MRATGGEGLDDLVNNAWEEANLLLDTVPELLWYRHIQLLQALGGKNILMLLQFDQDQLQGFPEAKLIFHIVKRYFFDLPKLLPKDLRIIYW